MKVDYKCPECEAKMTVTEETVVCLSCDHSLTITEAEEKFEAGELLAFIYEKEDDDDDEDDEEDDEDEDDDEEDDKKKDDKKKKFTKEEIDYKIDVSEDISALVDGEELSEEFQKKAALLYETAVNTKVAEISKTMRSNMEIELSEHVQEATDDLTEKVDKYLDYVVTEWMEENKLEVESGLRTEMTDEFMSKLHTLFTESFVEVPESRFDLVESLANKIEELEGQLDTKIEESLELTLNLSKNTAAMLFVEASEGLADTEIEKFQSLVENVEFDDAESYIEKLATLKESYFKKSNVSNNSIVNEEGVNDASDKDDEYGDLIARSINAIRSRDT